ncbi:AAA family ATPase [soil metagenome]
MSSRVLSVEQLKIHRMYRLDFDLHVEKLSPGLNILYGPNGTGKTTVGRVVHGVLWPSTMEKHNPTVEGRFRLDGSEYLVTVEGGRAVYQRDGKQTVPPDLPDAKHRSRYRLPLHGLIAETGDTFAKIIQQEAAGGLDVSAAADSLGFSAGTGRRRGLTEAFAAAAAAVERATREQEGVHGEQQRLEGLRERRAEAGAAAIEAREIELALNVVRAQIAYDEASKRLEGFESAFKTLRAEDADDLRALRELSEEKSREVQLLQAALDALRARRAEHAVVRAGEPASPVFELEHRCQKLTDLEIERRAARDARDRAQTESQETLRRLNREADVAALDSAEALTIADLQEVEDYVKDAQEVTARIQAIEARQRALGTDDSEQLSRKAEEIRSGLVDLFSWLRAEAAHLGGSSLRAPALIAAGVLAMFALVLAWYWNPASLALLLGALALGIFAFRLPTHTAERSDTHRRRFDQRGLDAPSEWTPDRVALLVEKLQSDLSETRVKLRLSERREGYGDDEAALHREQQKLHERRQALVQRLGVEPDAGDLSFVTFSRLLTDWLRNRIDFLAFEARYDRLAREIAGELAINNRGLLQFGLDEAHDTAAARARVGTLRELYETLATLDHQIEVKREALASAERERDRAEIGITTLCERLTVDEAKADDTVKRLCERLDDYKEADRGLERARANIETALRAFEHSKGREELQSLSEYELEEGLETAQELAATEHGLIEEISAIETKVARLFTTDELQNALAARDAALDELEAHYDETIDKDLGQLLAEHVKERHRDEHLPAVFHEAKGILSRITRDRYDLEMDGAGFAAYDNVRGRGFRLDELSGGTRVQLLLAVRLGFIAVEEEANGVALPLILDEVLANSDDERAEVIIDATLVLADSGRQIFYFTAQADEVAKWRRVIGDRDHRLIPLGTARLPERVAPDELPGATFAEVLPDPAGHDLESYRDSLSVPPWSGWQEVSEIHVWYLCYTAEDVADLLHAGFRAWGQVAALRRSGRAGILPLTEQTLNQMAVRAHALEAWREAWIEGRGKPIDLEALEHCDAVSSTFLDRVWERCRKLERNAEAFLQSLYDDPIPRFASQREALREYLIAEGYLDESDTKTDEEVWEEVAQRVADEAGQAGLSLADLRAFLGRVREAARPRGSKELQLDLDGR